MSFVKNFLFGGVKTSDDPTGLSGKPDENKTSASEEPIVEGKFFPRTLYKFNGHDDEKIFIAVKGKVFDCSQGRQFYGPSGPYSNFAGHDASRGLATNSFELDTVRPVSYTHLDVYKRQAPFLLLRVSNQSCIEERT